MSSTLAWLDHDAAARDRMERVLALFEERSTVDELGLGTIRDAFADRLFPGTSTIQTRLRYFLFIPWIYQRLERDQVPSHRAAEEGRRLEYRLTQALLGAEDTDGVFGKEAGRRLKRLASEVYWAGLAEWGIRRAEGSRPRYLSALDAIYRRRHELALRSGEDSESPSHGVYTWHPGLPDPPTSFPEIEGLTLRLTREEAEYLQDRVQECHPRSLLAVLFREACSVDTEFPWQIPSWSDLSERHREILTHARIFSQLAEGATLLYNLLLARLADLDEKGVLYARDFEAWQESLDQGELAGWSTARMWTLTRGQGHTITPGVRRFVEEWLELSRSGRDVACEPAAADLIRRREERLKGPRSRFRNRSALDRWGGASGLGRFTFRWPQVKTYLRDLHAGLQAS